MIILKETPLQPQEARKTTSKQFLLSFVLPVLESVYEQTGLTISTFTEVISTGVPSAEKHAFSAATAKQNRFE